MGITKISQKFVTQVTPQRMFNALILDSHNLCPKLMFSSIKSIEFLSGSGEVGTIKQINFTEDILSSTWCAAPRGRTTAPAAPRGRTNSSKGRRRLFPWLPRGRATPPTPLWLRQWV